MTYCVGLLLNEGIVLLSDTRTNAGIDNISSYKKMFTWSVPGERVIAMMTAGSLSVTQTVIARLQEAIDDPEGGSVTPSILLAPSMLAVAESVGNLMADVRTEISGKLGLQAGMADASIIVAGQRAGGRMRLFMIYPEGNFIEATADTPFLQLGEHKYGKPILDRVITPQTSLANARKAALLSMDSTLRSNLSVGMPLDLVTILADQLSVASEERFLPGDPRFTAMSDAWSDALRQSFEAMPG